MKTKIRSRLIFLGSLVLLLVAFAFWYKATYAMEEVSGYTVNSIDMPNKIAIATQGSTFKNAIVINIINHYKKDSIFINVLDVAELPTLSVNEYNAIVILHTWEYGNPPKEVKGFIEDKNTDKMKCIVMATSGQGTHKIIGVDALVGESILENTSDLSDEIIERIEKLIK